MKLIYEFPPTGGGIQNGFNDGAMENFRGHVPYHVTREAIQNIIDAAVIYPVKAKFDLVNIKGSWVPEKDQLENILSACKKYWPKDKKTQKFFSNALDLLTRDRNIHTLKISDYNTSGLTDRNYFKLMKIDGTAEKESDKGGAFGLGKHAFFIASHFRTIFVSSVYENDKHIFQGRLKLVSFKMDGDVKQSCGYFGNPHLEPVRDLESIPGRFSRDEQGTDIYILGFRWGDTWEKDIVKAVLNYYWNAILDNTLEVDVGDTEIRKNNLEHLLKKYFSEDEPDDNKEDPNPWPYYRAYTTPDKVNGKRLFKEILPTLREVELHILPGEIYRKKIACIRKTGMVIQKIDKRSAEAFAGVFMCKSDGNDILHDMENAAHNEWDMHNAMDSTMDKKLFPRAVKEMDEFIKTSLKDMVSADSESMDMPGLKEILGIPGMDREAKEASGNNPDSSKKEEGPEVGISAAEEDVKIKIPVWKMPPGPVPPGPDEGGRKRYEIGFRSFVKKDPKSNKIQHVLVIRSGKTKKTFDLVLKAGTEDSFYNLDISRAVDEKGKAHEVNGSEIKNLKMGSDGVMRITAEFDSNEKYSLKADAYENK
jgi:hypothetical protein